MELPDPAADWARIQAAGQLVVGTSADYPPFEYYNDAFQFAGFDIELLRAIGKELGVEVVFKDFAFDGLADALKLGQIDAAVAAITETPERATMVDFSSPYFASSEGYLVAAGAEFQSIEELAALSGLQVGTQRGSIYESWLTANLVDAGVIDAQNLVLYTSIDSAVADLGEGRLDLVVTDLPTAEGLRQTGWRKVGGPGFVQPTLCHCLAQRLGRAQGPGRPGACQRSATRRDRAAGGRVFGADQGPVAASAHGPHCPSHSRCRSSVQQQGSLLGGPVLPGSEHEYAPCLCARPTLQ